MHCWKSDEGEKLSRQYKGKSEKKKEKKKNEKKDYRLVEDIESKVGT